MSENYSIIHHGAKDGVTGSCHQLVLNNGASILIDCGLFQGAETSANEKAHFKQMQIDFDIKKIKALIVTHVHIDHIGRIPYLLAAGFNGPIICTQASAKLLPAVLEDAIKIGFTRHPKQVERFVQLIEKQMLAVKYHHWLPVIQHKGNIALEVNFKPAGHIIGSAFVQCVVKEKSAKAKIIFSGDLGAPNTPLLPAPKPPYGADTLVLETTYGNRVHQGRTERLKSLKEVIIQALSDQGTLIIPAFSIGRTQELLYEIGEIIRQSRNHKINKSLSWSDLEVIVDSPLAAEFTKLYRQLKPFWDKEAKSRLRMGYHPLGFEQITTINSHKEHLETVEYLAKTRRPAIVLAASGMCTGGRVVNYLKAMLEDQRHNIAFVGYQAHGTIGRVIQQYGPDNGYVEIDHQKYDIKAKIHTLGAYSAHADQNDLLRFVKRMKKWPSEIRLVHGNAEAKQALKEKLLELYQAKNKEVVIYV